MRGPPRTGAGGGGPREPNLAGAPAIPSAASVNTGLPVLEIKPRLSKQLSRRPLPATFPNAAWPEAGTTWRLSGATGPGAQLHSPCLGQALTCGPGQPGPAPAPTDICRGHCRSPPCHPSAAGRAYCPGSPACCILCPHVTSAGSGEQAASRGLAARHMPTCWGPQEQPESPSPLPPIPN